MLGKTGAVYTPPTRLTQENRMTAQDCVSRAALCKTTVLRTHYHIPWDNKGYGERKTQDCLHE